jgi:hypothetical protein
VNVEIGAGRGIFLSCVCQPREHPAVRSGQERTRLANYRCRSYEFNGLSFGSDFGLRQFELEGRPCYFPWARGIQSRNIEPQQSFCFSRVLKSRRPTVQQRQAAGGCPDGFALSDQISKLTRSDGSRTDLGKSDYMRSLIYSSVRIKPVLSQVTQE